MRFHTCLLSAVLLASCGLAAPASSPQAPPPAHVSPTPQGAAIAPAETTPEPSLTSTSSPEVPTETRIAPEPTIPPPGNLHSPSLSAGEWLAFVTQSHPPEGPFYSQVYVYNVATGETKPVGEMSRWPSLSSDGRYLAFEEATGSEWVYVYDTNSDQVELASVSSAGESADGHSGQADISDDGRFVVFFSSGSNLDSGDRNDNWDIYLSDRQEKTTVLVSRGMGGAAGNSSSETPVISADGSTIAFWSWASDLVPGDEEMCGDEIDPQNCGDIFIYDLQTGELERLRAGELNALGHNGYTLSLSADGRYLAFYESIYDRQTGLMETICEAGESSHCAFDPRLSADGQRVAYSDGQVWVYDRETGDRQLASASPDSSPGNGVSGRVFHIEDFFGSLDLSPDGRRVVFSSSATNLAGDEDRPAGCLEGPVPPYDVPGCYGLYLRDLETGSITEIRINP